MTKIHLTAVTDRHMKSGYPRWRYRRHVLGSILLWANRAGATRIEFREPAPEPFRYYDENGVQIETEMGQPPVAVRDDLFETLILTAIKGPAWLRALRKLFVRDSGRNSPDGLNATFMVADHEAGDSTWNMNSECTHAVFLKTDEPN